MTLGEFREFTENLPDDLDIRVEIYDPKTWEYMKSSFVPESELDYCMNRSGGSITIKAYSSLVDCM